MDESQQKVVDAYLEAIKWLRNHIPPDDIYEFAQQSLMAAEFVIGKLHEKLDLEEEMKNDPMLAHWVKNIFSLHQMKEAKFEGIVNVAWRLEKK